MRTFKEELGHDNEWGRPELTKKMLAATPHQRIEILKHGVVTGEWEFEMKKEFLKRLRGESLEEGMYSNVAKIIGKAVKNISKMETQKGHYENWKKEEAKNKLKGAKK